MPLTPVNKPTSSQPIDIPYGGRNRRDYCDTASTMEYIFRNGYETLVKPLQDNVDRDCLVASLSKFAPSQLEIMLSTFLAWGEFDHRSPRGRLVTALEIILDVGQN